MEVRDDEGSEIVGKMPQVSVQRRPQNARKRLTAITTCIAP
jgi:hypothetical protein